MAQNKQTDGTGIRRKTRMELVGKETITINELAKIGNIPRMTIERNLNYLLQIPDLLDAGASSKPKSK